MSQLIDMAAAPRSMIVGARPRKQKRRLGRWGLAFLWLRRVAVGFVLMCGLWTAAYALVEPPYTLTMASRAVQGADVRRAPVPLAAISPHLVRAVIAAEDTRFCAHGGFDHEAIERAMNEARQGRRLRGASTISQQTAKNAFLWTGGGWPRKAAEAGFTSLIELGWSKRRILEVYLNAAEWGDGVFGAEAAAQARFGKSAAELTAREAALLAAVLPSPNRWRLDPPGPYVASRAATIEARMAVVARDGLAACVLGST
jgi:monofunctional biosynthetic peptidoglycan transglycosylase